MKVLFVTTSYPASADDPRGNHVRVLARQLVADGDEVTVIAPSRYRRHRQPPLEGVTVMRFGYWPGGGTLTVDVAGIVPALKKNPLRLGQIPSLFAAMSRAVAREAPNYDIIHAHWLYPAGAVAVRAALHHDKPVVITAHGGDADLATRRRPLKWTALWAIRNAAVTMSVSSAIADSLVHLGAEPDQVAVTPLGVPVPTATAPLIAQPPRLLFVGSLIERKGLDILLDALDGIDPGTLELVVVGNGPLRHMLEDRAKGNSAIKPMGACPPVEVVELMQSASALVLPSRSEGRPFVVMEAMAAGLPVIATSIPGTRELVEDGVTGLLCDVDAASLRRAMTRMAADADLRCRLGSAGRSKLISDGLTSEQAARRVRSHYQVANARFR